MTTASLELCKELYQLSGWQDCQMMFDLDEDNAVVQSVLWKGMHPAYDLGYLLRKLPDFCAVSHTIHGGQRWYKAWCEGHYVPGSKLAIVENAATPEDAACKLAIELFKQGILK